MVYLIVRLNKRIESPSWTIFLLTISKSRIEFRLPLGRLRPSKVLETGGLIWTESWALPLAD